MALAVHGVHSPDDNPLIFFARKSWTFCPCAPREAGPRCAWAAWGTCARPGPARSNPMSPTLPPCVCAVTEFPSARLASPFYCTAFAGRAGRSTYYGSTQCAQCCLHRVGRGPRGGADRLPPSTRGYASYARPSPSHHAPQALCASVLRPPSSTSISCARGTWARRPRRPRLGPLQLTRSPTPNTSTIP